jgi:hypothetical protein
MSRPAPRPTDRKGAFAALAVAGAGLVLMALVSLALDALLAARLRAALAQSGAPVAGVPVTLPHLTGWECRALTGRMWYLPLAPALSHLPVPPGALARPVRGRCAWAGYSPVILTSPAPGVLP